MNTFRWRFVVIWVTLVVMGAGITWAQAIHLSEPMSQPMNITVEQMPSAFKVANCLSANTPLASTLPTVTQIIPGLNSIRSCPACSIPSDPRVCCMQYADHYSACATDGCGAEKQRWHRCWRYCYPNQQNCGGWNTMDMGCVYSDCGLRDSCQSCSGSCPFKAAPSIEQSQP